jgi:hypothetical protein
MPLRHIWRGIVRRLQEGDIDVLTKKLRTALDDMQQLSESSLTVFRLLCTGPYRANTSDDLNLSDVLQRILHRSYTFHRGVFSSIRDHNILAAHVNLRSQLEHFILTQYLREIALQENPQNVAQRYSMEYAAAEALEIERKKLKYNKLLKFTETDIDTQILLQGYGNARVTPEQLASLGGKKFTAVMQEFGFTHMLDVCLKQLGERDDSYEKRLFLSHVLIYSESSGYSHGGPSGDFIMDVLSQGGLPGFYWQAIGLCCESIALFCGTALLYCFVASRAVDIDRVMELANKNSQLNAKVSPLGDELTRILKLPNFRVHVAGNMR